LSNVAEYIDEVAGVEGIDRFKLKRKIEFVCTLDPNNAHFVSTDTLITSQNQKGHTFVYCPKHKDYMDVTLVEPNGFEVK
jgi:hypothetical protein